MTTHRAPLNLLLGGGLVVLLLASAALSLVWTPYAYDAIDIAARLDPPSARHWLGTDPFGRDVLSRILVGARMSIAVGFVAVGVGLLAGVALGGLAAARRGWVDELVMGSSDVVFAFPAILSALLITVTLGPGVVNAVLAIGIFNIPVFARVTRRAALGIWAMDYARAAAALGQGGLAVTWRHVLPNVAPLLIVQASVQFAIAILAEAALSYLGLGAQPPIPSWGRMLYDAQTLLALQPTLALFPGLAIMLAVLGLNLLGDGLADRLDPRLRAVRLV
ncbi:MAG: ABC transporter permease [Alphaproteobacteria bacterium]|nr:ABC transporter permease [Alphaproteobacteria bacterium]